MINLQPPLVLITNLKDASSHLYEGINVSSTRSLDAQPWQAWLSEPTVEVFSCEYPTIKTLGTGVNTKGKRAFFVDGKIVEIDRDKEIRKYVQNKTSIMLDHSLNANLPVFLFPDKPRKTVSYDVNIKMNIFTLDQVPDFKTWSAFRIWFHFETLQLYSKDRESSLPTHLQELEELAQNTFVDENLYLPCHVQSGHNKIDGVLFLVKEIGPFKFNATLYLADEPTNIFHGLQIWREASWHHNDYTAQFSQLLGMLV